MRGLTAIDDEQRPVNSARGIGTKMQHGSCNLDMDGTIALGDAASGGHKPLPFATETLDALRARGAPYRVFTNGSAKPPAAYAASLRRSGFDVRDDEMMTPSSSAALWFVKQGISRVRVLGNEGVGAPLLEAGITVIGPSEKAEGVEAVYTGWFREFTFPDMEAACRSIWDGAILTTASHVPFFATATGRAIGANYAISVMITSLTGKRAKVLGKPSRIAFDATARSMGPGPAAAKDIVVVGDDPALEMRMANGAGTMSAGMMTGLMRRDTVSSLTSAETPSVCLDSIAPLLDAVKASGGAPSRRSI
jgi:4-nitrophenyl phosphatase